jgi:hypothetical protein
MSFTVDDVANFNKRASLDPHERLRWVEWANSYLKFTSDDRGEAAAYANKKIALERRRGRRNPERPEWDELQDVQGAIYRGLRIDKLWSSVGQGDMKYALGLISDHWDVDDATEVKVVAEPDDMLGELIRVWVR